MTLFERFKVATPQRLAQRLSRESRPAVATQSCASISLFHEIVFHSDLYDLHYEKVLNIMLTLITITIAVPIGQHTTIVQRRRT